MPGSIVLLTGRSFSGKSTAAALLGAALPATTLAYDAINAERGLRSGDGVPVAEWLRTNDEAHERARTLLADGAAVVVDDTSSPRFLRDGWRRLAREAGASFVLVLVDVDPAEIRRRWTANRASGGRHDVTDEVMAAHLAAFETPGVDEPHLRWTGSADDGALVEAVRTALRR